MVIGADNLSEYERLLALAENENVNVHENYDLGSNKFKGLYCNNNVALSYSLEDTASQTCVLAEELGQYYTATQNILDLSDIEKSKQERKGRIWAYEKLITKEAIDVAFRSGCREYWEVAEYLDMDCEFLYHAMIYYGYIDV